MPFDDLKPNQGGKRTKGAPTISVGSNKSVRIRLGQLNAKLGWQIGDHFAVQLGRGDDKGWLRIAPLPKGSPGFLFGRDSALSKQGRFLIAAAKLGAAAAKRPSEEVRWQLDGPAVLLWLPWVEDPAAKQESEFDDAVKWLIGRGGSVTPGNRPGLFLVDGREHTKATLVEHVEKLKRRSLAAATASAAA